MLKVLLLSLSRQYTVDSQYIPSLFIEPEVRHDKTSYIEKHALCLKDYRIRSFLSIQYVHGDLFKHLGIDSSSVCAWRLI